jgi:hypothetical protein
MVLSGRLDVRLLHAYALEGIMIYNVGDLVTSKQGRIFELDDVNPNYGKSGYEDEYFASGWSEFGTEIVDSPGDIVLFMTKEQAQARKLPTEDEIASGLSLTGSGWNGAVDVDETDNEGGGEISCFGTTNDGQRISFTVKVLNVVRES